MRLKTALYLLCPALALAQAGTWTAPRLGYFFDPDSKAIRVLAGVPGAAAADDTLAFASKLESAWTAPGRTFALATVHDVAGLQLLAWSNSGVNTSQLDQSIQPTLVAFSPSGSAAVLWNKDSSVLQVWSGLPDAPRLARQLSAHGVTAAAATDDAALLALVDDTGATVYAQDKDVQHLPFVTAVQFLGHSTDLVAAFASTNQVQLIRTPGPHAAVTTLAGPSEGISGPVSLAVAGSSRQVAVANSAGRSVTLIDLDAGSATTLSCNCTPRQVSPLVGQTVFHVASDSPLVVDRRDGSWRVTTVPTNGGSR
jgi:hypothetical protein